MINWGSVPIGSVLPFPFASYASATGASVTLSGLLVTDIEVFKGTSMTQRSSDNGYALLDTDGIDVDGVTGIHGFSIDTGDNSDAGFFVPGAFYYVVVSAVTIDTQTVNFIAGTFRLVDAENAIYNGTITGASPTTTTLVDSGLTQSGNDHWKGRILIFTSGALKYQATLIMAFSAGSDQLTFETLTAAPAQGDRYVVL